MKAKRLREPASAAHPDVVAYRDKLRSIGGKTTDDLVALDRKLDAYLEKIRTPLPPPMPAAPGVDRESAPPHP
jgi:hypothetical protein